MLLYTDIVNKALNREVLPVMQQVLNQAMNETYGTDWYQSVGRDVLSKIRDFDRIDEKISGSLSSPVENMDLTSIFFLLTPYETRGEEVVYLDGFMNVLAEYAHLEEWQVRRLSRIRTIRNNAAHDRVDQGDPTDQASLQTGVNEKKWLQELEDILKFFKADVTLFDYQKQLSDDILSLQNKNQNSSTATVINNKALVYINQTEQMRSEIKRIYPFDFMDAKLHAPMTEPAPWVQNNADFDELPWPSKILPTVQQQEVKVEEPKTEESEKVLINPDIDKKLSDAATATSDLINKGFSAIMNRFNKK